MDTFSRYGLGYNQPTVSNTNVPTHFSKLVAAASDHDHNETQDQKKNPFRQALLCYTQQANIARRLGVRCTTSQRRLERAASVDAGQRPGTRSGVGLALRYRPNSTWDTKRQGFQREK